MIPALTLVNLPPWVIADGWWWWVLLVLPGRNRIDDDDIVHMFLTAYTLHLCIVLFILYVLLILSQSIDSFEVICDRYWSWTSIHYLLFFIWGNSSRGWEILDYSSCCIYFCNCATQQHSSTSFGITSTATQQHSKSNTAHNSTIHRYPPHTHATGDSMSFGMSSCTFPVSLVQNEG
jgi:hypothetical protein